MNASIVILAITSLIAICILVLAWKYRSVRGAYAIVGLMISVTLWSIFYTLELISRNIEIQILFSKIEYIGIVSIPALWLTFILSYTGKNQWLHKRGWLLIIEPLATLALVWSNEFHRTVWTSIRQIHDQGVVYLDLGYGWVFWTNVVYSYFLLLVGMVIVFRYVLLFRGIYRRQAVMILIGASFPWIGNLLYVSKITPFPHLDLSPIGFTITGVVSIWAILFYHFFDLVPLAREIVLENLEDVILVINNKNILIDINYSGRQIFWPDKKDPIGLEVDEFLKPYPALLYIINNFQRGRSEVSLKTPSEPETFEVQITPVNDENQIILGKVILIHDITKRKQMELDLIRAKETSEVANRIKSDFLANISHELRTPLSIIINYTELVQMHLGNKQDKENIQRLDHVLTSAEELLKLITNILDFSKAKSGQLGLETNYFEVTPLLVELEAEMQSVIQRNENSFSMNLLTNLGIMYSDPNRIKEILTHLLANAAKFTTHGHIYLDVSRQTQDDGDWLTFHVRDTGIGMTPEQVADLFQAFYQADASKTTFTGGVGLGLVISRQLSQLLGGDITVTSSQGQGSVFTVRLPAHLPQQSTHEM